jgi:hypothetical protein
MYHRKRSGPRPVSTIGASCPRGDWQDVRAAAAPRPPGAAAQPAGAHLRSVGTTTRPAGAPVPSAEAATRLAGAGTRPAGAATQPVRTVMLAPRRPNVPSVALTIRQDMIVKNLRPDDPCDPGSPRPLRPGRRSDSDDLMDHHALTKWRILVTERLIGRPYGEAPVHRVGAGRAGAQHLSEATTGSSPRTTAKGSSVGVTALEGEPQRGRRLVMSALGSAATLEPTFVIEPTPALGSISLLGAERVGRPAREIEPTLAAVR